MVSPPSPESIPEQAAHSSAVIHPWRRGLPLDGSDRSYQVMAHPYGSAYPLPSAVGP